MISKLKAALECSAILDAIGYVYEFEEDKSSLYSLLKSREKFNISDDTQLTLFGFEAALRTKPDSDINLIVSKFSESYQCWLYSQGYESTSKNSELLNEALMVQRAPGFSTLSSLLTPDKRFEINSCGSGAVMKLLPLMIYSDRPDFLNIVQKVTELTHTHVEAIYYAKILSTLYASVISGTNYPSIQPIRETMEGWIASEAVIIAYDCFSRSNTFEELIINCINRKGDVDTIGAIAGTMWGLVGKEYDKCLFQRLAEKKEIKMIEEKMQEYVDYLAMFESKQVGVVYHFTIPQYYEIMSNSEKAKEHNIAPRDFILFGIRGVSLTRNYRLPAHPQKMGGITHDAGYLIRISIDGVGLSNSYKIKPVLGFDYNQNDTKAVLDVNKGSRVSRNSGEAEEFVIPKGEHVDIKKYILQIDFMDNKSEFGTEWIDKQIQILKVQGIKANRVRVWNPVKM